MPGKHGLAAHERSSPGRELQTGCGRLTILRAVPGKYRRHHLGLSEGVSRNRDPVHDYRLCSLRQRKTSVLLVRSAVCAQELSRERLNRTCNAGAAGEFAATSLVFETLKVPFYRPDALSKRARHLQTDTNAITFTRLAGRDGRD